MPLDVKHLGLQMGLGMTPLEPAREEWNDNKNLCAYCQSASLISFITLFFAAPEALRAARSLLGKK